MEKPGLPSIGISNQFLKYTPVSKPATVEKEDYSHKSGYWNDKKYGHVAPDGTVHPQRYADRIKEREAYEKTRKGQ